MSFANMMSMFSTIQITNKNTEWERTGGGRYMALNHTPSDFSSRLDLFLLFNEILSKFHIQKIVYGTVEEIPPVKSALFWYGG